MARISHETIESVRNSADILDVVSQVVDLRKRGKNYFGLCPFHPEKTPSFSVAPDKQIFHCFGCGMGGNAFNFLMEYEKLSFVEAVKSLGDRYGIEVKLSSDPGSQELYSNLYELHVLAATVYQKTLNSEPGAGALTYLKDRGLSEDLIHQFQLGFATDSWDRLLKAAKAKKFPPDAIAKSGLFTHSEKGTFDRFRSRIMIPIFNPSGKVIAFGGRTFGTEDPAKYLNSPDTPLYHKSDVFYGLHASRDSIRKSDFAILVEGYMDFLQLYQHGITNVVAVSGTALTERHVNQIRKFASRIVLVYDGDSAGVNAALRAGYTLFEGGVEPLIVKPPDEMDPDDWIRKNGTEAILAAIDRAQPLLNFHIEQSGARKFQAAQKSRFVKEIVRNIAAIQDGIIRDELLKSLGQELNVGERELIGILQKQKQRPVSQGVETKQTPLTFNSPAQRAQVEIIKLLAGEDLDARQLARDQIELSMFQDLILRRLAEILLPQYESLNYAAIADQFESRAERESVTRILMEDLVSDNPEQVIKDCVTALLSVPIKEKIKTARLKIRELESAGKDPSDLLMKIAELQLELKALSN